MSGDGDKKEYPNFKCFKNKRYEENQACNTGSINNSIGNSKSG